MHCSQCRAELSPEWKFCSQCGIATPERMIPDSQSKEPSVPVIKHGDMSNGPNGSPFFAKFIPIAVVIAILAIIVIVSQPKSSETGSSTGLKVNADTPLNDVADSAMDEAMNAVANPSDTVPQDTISRWSYSQDTDKVRGATTYYAFTTSTNKIYQSSPYGGGTSMRMTLRKHPGYGTDVILTISEGQMMCPSYKGCSGMVRFDDGAAQRVSFSGPADNDSETIFVDGAKAFIAKLKKAKHVVIEKTLYSAGNPQFEFDVAELKWEH